MINISIEEILSRKFFIYDVKSGNSIPVVRVSDLLEFDRPKGKWIKDCESCDCIHCYESGARFTRKDCSGRCSICGEYECCTDNFCPNCGADMRSGEEE